MNAEFAYLTLLFAMQNTSRTMDFEVKYRKFPIRLGQRLTDIPEYLAWKQKGWIVKWAHVQAEGDDQFVETLMHRTPHDLARQTAGV